MVQEPMTTCGCCECIAAMLPSCNGVMTVHRDYTGRDPLRDEVHHPGRRHGRRGFSPGFVGHSKFNITQRKFIAGDGGLLRMVWMPKILKDEIKERLEKRGEELGVGIYDMIADETVGITEEEILPFLQEKGHPALSMDPLIG
jgi:acetyl-CoA synthase